MSSSWLNISTHLHVKSVHIHDDLKISMAISTPLDFMKYPILLLLYTSLVTCNCVKQNMVRKQEVQIAIYPQVEENL